jgi:POT family proton-dependent oligopeptide transporter
MPANPILDFESAPVRPEGLPTAHQLHQQDGVSGYQDNQYADKLDEQAMNEVHDATVVPAYEEDEDYEGKPTEEELRTLRKIGAPLPFAASAMCLVELAERYVEVVVDCAFGFRSRAVFV